MAHTEAKQSRPVRYFAVTYFDGEEVLSGGRQSVFRSKRLCRAKRIARSNMPLDADRMELVEINGADFDERREARRQCSGELGQQ
ncbi:hypothetical protein AU381_05895 [Sinorhizobium glycinis]|uniref:Uncharacterized protein n=1 Tax=Sinorhizobium glycinis TaxID=1472378 RepID=A0A178Y1D5_9HYPH|nr:hypothetical protein [Sinorhizobium glycinis]OAP41399.1 hypothetical protein AU381_05895 [Sinorhizobium glycinis]